MAYNPWPIGRLPENWWREELARVVEAGYKFDDPRELNTILEQKLADFSGAKYAVLVDCASNGIFLSLKYLGTKGSVVIPRQTYISVPMQIIHAGAQPILEDIQWSGLYNLGNTPIYDSAARFSPNMFVGGNSLQVLSFQIKKRLPIGRGGAILTDDADAAAWLRLARYDGRDLDTAYNSDDHVKQIGWHMYMTPEDAARGILLFDQLLDDFSDVADNNSYPDISNWLSEITK
jgi:dTDP-4-amino-4,6-dideoxygalactose transaminase